MKTQENKLRYLNDAISLIQNPIDGEGIFDSISSLASKYLPSIIKQAKVIAPSILEAGKKVIKNPKNQKAALDFVKEKLKKKEPEKPKELTEREQLFNMFKNKEISAQEYKELKSDLQTDLPKTEIPIKTEIPKVDDNLKNLSGQTDVNKIYLDLLTKKLITPEQYMEITSGKKLNLSKPINPDNYIKPEIPEIKLDGSGFKKTKRKYKSKL